MSAFHFLGATAKAVSSSNRRGKLRLATRDFAFNATGNSKSMADHIAFECPHCSGLSLVDRQSHEVKINERIKTFCGLCEASVTLENQLIGLENFYEAVAPRWAGDRRNSCAP